MAHTQPGYEFLPNMAETRFVRWIVAMVKAAHDHFLDDDPHDVYRRGAIETLSHQIAVFFAQRYNASVPTEEPLEYLELEDVDMSDRKRAKLVRNFIATFTDR